MTSFNKEQFFKTVTERFSNLQIEEENFSAYYNLRFQYKSKEYNLSLYNPNKDLDHFDIGLTQLQRVSTGLNPEDQNLLYWHVTSILDKINKQLDEQLGRD